MFSTIAWTSLINRNWFRPSMRLQSDLHGQSGYLIHVGQLMGDKLVDIVDFIVSIELRFDRIGTLVFRI